MSTDLSIILKEIISLKLEIRILSNKINNLDKSCSRMDGHINFVENTYSTLRSPLNIFSSIINKFYGNVEDTTDLPTIENNK